MKINFKEKSTLAKGIIAVILFVLAIILASMGCLNVMSKNGDYTFQRTDTFIRVGEALSEEYEDETICPVEFSNGEYTLIVKYSFEEWEKLESGATKTGYIYKNAEGEVLCLDHEALGGELRIMSREVAISEQSNSFGMALALIFSAIGVGVMLFYHKDFTRYEQIWFIAIIVLASLVSIIFPEEEINGINGLIIMALYLADTFLNILCELLISKQSKWNFIVSIFVELCEIAICIVLAYRFATLASTLFFWLPCDIISFINWNRHPDKQEEELTIVRTLKGWQEVLIVSGIVVWTVVVGFLLSNLDISTTLFGGNRTLEVLVCYLDAMASAVGVVNGVFILLRLREQWIAWYISAFLEGIMNILSGQYVLLVLKLGYITNTTYGYIKWTRYIKSKK